MASATATNPEGMKIPALVLALAIVLPGCGGNATPQPSTSNPLAGYVSLSVPLSSSGGSIVFPSTFGYGGSFVYSANDAAVGTTARIAVINAPSANLLPGQAPSGNLLVAFELTLGQSVTFAKWYRLLTTITIPPSVSTAGRAFSEYGYDVTKGVAEGSNPGTVNGTTSLFNPGLGPVMLLANHTYLIVLAMQ